MRQQLMGRWLKRLILPPIFPDKELTRAARWLNFLLLLLISLLVVDSIGILLGLLDQDAITSVLTANLFGLLTIFGVLLLMRRGRVKLAASSLLTILFLLITYSNAIIFQSIRTPSAMTYFALIPLAGLLLGRRMMNRVAGLCMATIAVIFVLELTGWLTPPPDGRSLFDDVVVLFFTIGMNTILLNASIRRIEEKADEIRQAATALETANQQLQTSQAELEHARADLEDRVKHRTEQLRLANAQLQGEAQERQHVLEALRQSEANWRSLATNVPELIATINTRHVITSINRAVSGHSPESLTGAPAVALYRQPKDQALLEQSMARAWETGETVSFESEVASAEGNAWYINRVGAIKQDGQVTALILISTDITEQKQTEAAMYQAQKLESLGVLAGGVAHDFNNLLAAMLMQMSSAATKLPTDHPVSQHIQRTIMAAERAADLTRQMLNYTGRNPSEAKPMDLNDLITDNIHLFSASRAKTVKLDPLLSSSIPLMVGDKGQIQQLIMNLILNSAEAIGEKTGAITVVTDVQELTGEESQFWRWSGARLAAGRYVKLEVSDTGSGMDAKTLTKIFDPFFTTKFTGRGLGLAGVLGIVRSHKGGLSVTSAVGKGTTFTILFPALYAMPALAPEVPDLAPMTMADGLAVVIDDEEMVRESIADILSETGLQVLTAADGPAGIELFREHAEAIDLVLLDLSMPGMNGEQVFYALQAINPDVPVLLISGYSEHEVMERFVNTGLAGFIQKPFTIDSLLQNIQPHVGVANYR